MQETLVCEVRWQLVVTSETDNPLQMTRSIGARIGLSGQKSSFLSTSLPIKTISLNKNPVEIVSL